MRPCPPFSYIYRMPKCSIVLPDGKVCGQMVKARNMCAKHYRQFQETKNK